MASNLGTRETQSEGRKLQLRQTFSQGLRARTRYEFRGPFHGYTPDLPHNLIDESFFGRMTNLVVKSGPSAHGEVVMNDAGYEKTDSASLPLGDHANTENDICFIGQFDLTNDKGFESSTLSRGVVAFSAGDNSNAGSQQMWTITEGETAWREIPASGAAGTVAMKAKLAGNQTSLQQQSLMDVAEFPLGAGGRSAHTGAISQPALVFTNNVDNVMVFPAATSNATDYEEITDRFNGTFQCISLETYNDRMFFLNTVENDSSNDIRYRNRLRYSARGTCDPLETTAGAGQITIEEFTVGLKVLTLGDVLVVYFTDGIAFVRDTFNSAAPLAVQIISPAHARRGILGTHAAVEVPGKGHFGIYNDGWWMVDANGRMEELGLHSVQGTDQFTKNPGRPEMAEKWKRTFYNTLDADEAHRIHCTYESKHDWVRIIVPTSPTDSEVWIYDVLNNRVYKAEYPVAPTVYGRSVIQLDTAEAWSDQVDGVDTWSAISGSWDSFSADQGEEFILHGDVSGNVFIHKEDVITHDGQQPNWDLETVETDFDSMADLKRFDKAQLQHINSGNTSLISITVTNNKQLTQTITGVLDDASGDPEDIEISEAHFTGPTGETLKVDFSGSGSVQIRGYAFELVERKSERIGG